jgi:hypothetical protein
MKKIAAGIAGLIALIGAAGMARGVVVELSLDGIAPAPEQIQVIPGEVVGLYVLSPLDGEGYFKYLTVLTLYTIENIQVWPAAGDSASVGVSSGQTHWPMLTAADSAGDIIAGIHFSFDLRISESAIAGESRSITIYSTPLADDWIELNVVPEPASAVVLSVGAGVLALVQRRRRSRI